MLIIGSKWFYTKDSKSGTNNCHFASDCKNSHGGYECSCHEGFNGTGLVCEDIDECESLNNCHKDAACNNFASNFTCTCNKGTRSLIQFFEKTDSSF